MFSTAFDLSQKFDTGMMSYPSSARSDCKLDISLLRCYCYCYKPVTASVDATLERHEREVNCVTD